MAKNTRPVIPVPNTPLGNFLDLASLLLIALLTALTIWGWLTLPDIVPTHFNIWGQPDRYGSKIVLFIWPAVAILFYWLFSFLSRYPRIYNYPVPITPENAPRQYLLAYLLVEALKLELVLTFFLLQWSFIQAMRTHFAGLMLLITPATIIVIFTTLFMYLRLARRAR